MVGGIVGAAVRQTTVHHPHSQEVSVRRSERHRCKTPVFPLETRRWQFGILRQVVIFSMAQGLGTKKVVVWSVSSEEEGLSRQCVVGAGGCACRLFAS